MTDALRRLLVAFLPLGLLTLASCTTDSYDKGEGRNSLTEADFAELTVNSEKKGVSFLTDEGVSYVLSSPVTAKWIQTADTTYRTIIYYKEVEKGQKAEVEAMGLMTTLRPGDPKRFKEQPEDPLGLESVWLAPSGKYINVGLLVKSGRDEEGNEGVQTLGLVWDEVRRNTDGTTTACYRLLHDQKDTPEYYTNRRYVSILLPAANRPDSVRLSVPTYEGRVVRVIALR